MFSTNRWAASFIDGHPRLPAIAKRASAAHVCACVLIFATTYWPSGPILPDELSVVLSILPIFPYWFVAVSGMVAMAMDSSSGFGRLSGMGAFRQIWRRVPKPLILLGAVGFYGAWLIGFTNSGTLRGQPEIAGGQYEINDHGGITVVDRATYEQQLAAEERLFAVGGVAFGASGYVILTAAAARAMERQDDATEPPTP